MLCRVIQFCATSVVMTAALAEETAGGGRSGAPVTVPAASALSSSSAAADARSATEKGIASVYATELEGRPTASGALYDSQKLTAAHRSLPFGSRIRVTDVASAKSVTVTVNDRWSGGPGQIVNLSRRAADELGLRGNAQRQVAVTVETLGDGRRQAAAAGSALLLLPDRIEAAPTDRSGRTRVCANEADILGLREALWESHVRNCLGRKAKTGAAETRSR